MFKKLSFAMMILCMLCSSVMPSLNAECPCKRRPAKNRIKDIKGTTQNINIIEELVEDQISH